MWYYVKTLQHPVNLKCARKTRKKQENEIDKMAKSIIRKPSKVKPGYKKKMQSEMEQIKKRQKRLSSKKK